MPTIPLREAEFLSYLQGCGPVGEWVDPSTKHISQDLKMRYPMIGNMVKQLVKRGFIEVSPMIKHRRHYRVLVRLETPGVEIVVTSPRSDKAKERMRQAAFNRRDRKQGISKKEAMRLRMEKVRAARGQYVITPRRKAVYDYLVTCAPPGQWFPIDYPQAYKACDMGKQNFSRTITQMIDCGIIEGRPSQSQPFGRDLRVVKEAEGDQLKAIQNLEVYVPPAPPPKKRKLIPYAGKDSREQAIW